MSVGTNREFRVYVGKIEGSIMGWGRWYRIAVAAKDMSCLRHQTELLAFGSR